MEIIIRGIVFLGIAFMFVRMMKGGGCCGQGAGSNKTEESTKSCCSNKE